MSFPCKNAYLKFGRGLSVKRLRCRTCAFPKLFCSLFGPLSSQWREWRQKPYFLKTMFYPEKKLWISFHYVHFSSGGIGRLSWFFNGEKYSVRTKQSIHSHTTIYQSLRLPACEASPRSS